MDCEQYLTIVPKGSVDLVDRAWLTEVVAMGQQGHTVDHWVADDGFRFWRLATGGVLVTQVLAHPGGKEFFVVGLGARKVRWKELWAAINVLAGLAGCRWIGAVAQDLKRATVMAAHGMEVAEIKMLKEI